jgi:oxaloacetate decarboxylase alpha subunit
VTRLVDTTIRLLSQQPLVGTISTARVLEVAEILDGAGFSSLEVSGGGCFDAAVQRGSESPWERMRALKARCPDTPLQMALRGRFLVGSKPLPDDLVRRFILCAAESGIEIFRLHDPLNDVENLESAAAAVRESGGRLYAGLAFSGYMPNLQRVTEKARRLAELGADHVLLHDPAGALDPGTCERVINELKAAAGVPVGLYCQGTGGNALAMAIEAARHGTEPIATAVLPVAFSLHRVAAEVLCDALTGLGLDHGVDQERLWAASRFIDEHVTSQMPAAPIPPRITLRTAQNRLPVGLVSELDARLRMLGSPDRLDEVLEEFKQVRMDTGMPPLAQPVGGILAGQSVRHVLSARRWAEVSDDMREYLSGVYGRPPQEIAPEAAVHAGPLPPQEPVPDIDELRAEGLAASEEDLLLLALFGDDAFRLLTTLRGRGDREESARDGLERSQAERIRELIEMMKGSDVGELTIEDGSVRITVRKQEERSATAQSATPAATAPAAGPLGAPNGGEPVGASVSTTVKIESPMVGTFYRSSSPTADPFVQEGDSVEVGQTLCVLEAMKLFNEFKSEHSGVIRTILVNNAEPVEYGQPLFELEPA